MSSTKLSAARWPRTPLGLGLGLGLGLHLVAAPALADDAAPPAAAEASSTELTIPYQKYRLPNGLEVILHEDHRTPFVAVSVWYHVGALHEEPGKSGFAHLFEHLMFQGTPNVGEDKHIAYLEEAGASIRSGMVNGTTSEDRTNYFEVVPSNQLDLALWLESDRMGYLMAGMTQAKLDEQREVVKNERRQSIENVPYGLAEEALWQKVFPKTHPYYGMVIGSMEDLNAASLDDVSSFYDTYYAPSNATLTIAGDFDEATVKAAVEKYFGTLPPWNPPPPRKVTPPVVEAPIRVDFEEPVGKLPFVQIMFLTPPFLTEQDAGLDVLAHILSSGKSSRLYRSLVEEEQIAQSVSAHQGSMGNVSTFVIEIMLKDGKEPQAAIDTVGAILEEMQYLPPEQDKIEQAVTAIETQRLFGLQKIGGFSGKAEQLQTYNHYVGDPGFLARDLARYRAVKPETLGELVKTYLVATKRAVLVAKPKAAADADAVKEGSK